jgi:hypothetical protein
MGRKFQNRHFLWILNPFFTKIQINFFSKTSTFCSSLFFSTIFWPNKGQIYKITSGIAKTRFRSKPTYFIFFLVKFSGFSFFNSLKKMVVHFHVFIFNRTSIFFQKPLSLNGRSVFSIYYYFEQSFDAF